MSKPQNLRNLLFPSLSSTVVITMLSIATVGIITLSWGTGNGAVYDFLFGPSSSADQIQTARSTISALSNTIFGNRILNQLLFFVLWMLIGLAVYVIVAGVNREVSDINNFREELRYANSRPSQTIHAFAVRTIIRSVVLASWGIYWIVFIKVYFPFTILCTHIGTGNLGQLSGWLYVAAGVGVFALSTHLHVVFLRLLVLRTRLFDSA